eukprot:Gb_14540 [translate_table: standard]
MAGATVKWLPNCRVGAAFNLPLLLFFNVSIVTGDQDLQLVPMGICSSNEGNANLVDRLQKYGILKNKTAVDAMRQIDRADYVLQRGSAYIDSPQPIGYSATISAPHMHAYCLDYLSDHLKPGMSVLDVGSGSGYLAAVFALMVGETGKTVGVEHIPQLVERSIESIKKGPAAHLFEKGALVIYVGDGKKGFPDAAPYDAIHVGAAAAELPKALVDQLKPGGRLVIPVVESLMIIDKLADESIHQYPAMDVRYVPLV